MRRYPVTIMTFPWLLITNLIPLYFMGLSFSGSGGPEGFTALTGAENFISFVMVGAILSMFTFAVFFGIGAGLKEEMDQGVLESNWITPAPRTLLLIGRSLASTCTTVIQVCVMMLLALPLGFSFGGSLIDGLGLVFVPTLVGLYGIGFALAGVALVAREVHAALDISSFGLNILTGQAYPVSILPRVLLTISLALPLTYGIDALRGMLLGTETLLPINQAVVLLWTTALVCVVFGLLVFVLSDRRARRRGTLAMH